MRYIPHTEASRKEMRESIGISDVDELFAQVPKEHLLSGNLPLPTYQTEQAVERTFSTLAAQNKSAADIPFFLGAGAYYHHIPATVDHIIQRSEFLTAYTPYQAEVSQGTLTAVFEFQSYIAALTGQDIANASMYDGATAVAEAALMARRITKRHNIMVIDGLHPEYEATVATYIKQTDAHITHEGTEDNACIIVQSPNYYGEVVDITPYRKICDETGALLIVAVAEIVSLGMLGAPSEADVVAGEAQSIGMPLSFGGPYLGFFACKQKYLRQMPGRLCGETVDADGKRSFTLTLNTREQHIRREKATSNICTNEGLCALAFTIHLSLLGEEGFKKLAQLNHSKACQLADKLEQVNGVTLQNKTFFNEFTIQTTMDAQELTDKLLQKDIIAGHPLPENKLLIAATECTTEKDMDKLCAALTEVLS